MIQGVNPNSFWPRRLALLLGAALVTGCSHGVVVRAHRGPVDAPVNARLALVAPVELRWNEPSSLIAYLRTLDVEESLCKSGRLATMGPGELAPLPGAPETPSETDVSRVALKLGLAVDSILLVRASAERREQRSQVALNDAKGAAAGNARDALVTLVARVELSVPALHLMLADSTAELELDPAVDHPLLDGQPELAALLQRAVDEAVKEAGDKLVLPAPIDLGLRTVPAPAPALLFALPKGHSFAQSIDQQDALEQEVSRDGALDLLTHSGPPLLTSTGQQEPIIPLSPEERRSLRPDKKGLRVIEVHSRARGAGLLPGDQILSIDTQPATHPCAPLRAVELSTHTPKLEVERGGKVIPISL
jgi:hypothetical protein